MFSRFLAKNVGSTSSFRSHFQQIESADPNLWLLSCLAVQNQNRWLTPIPTSNVHLKYGCRHLPWSCYKSVFVEVYAGLLVKRIFTNSWGIQCRTFGVVWCTLPLIMLLPLTGGGLASYMMFLCMDFGVVPHLWRSCKTAVQSWWKKGWTTALINGLCHVLGDLKIICCLLEWIVFQTPPKRFQVSLILRH